jgi:integrase
MASREEIVSILAVAPEPMRTAVLLAVNAALGPADISGLRVDHVDLEGQWLVYPRVKTGTDRKCWLWPETVAAIRQVIADRGEADSPNVFPSLRRVPGTQACKVMNQFRRMLERNGLWRRGLAFYSFRRTWRTIAGQTKDREAAAVVMGHVDNSMAAHYIEQFDDDRLRTVVEHVHHWLFS